MPAFDHRFGGTSLEGYIDVTYSELVKAFGVPTDGDGYKVDAEWLLIDDEGRPVTIYNYKDGKNYCGASGKDVTEITDWHVGSAGSGRYAVAEVLAELSR